MSFIRSKSLFSLYLKIARRDIRDKSIRFSNRHNKRRKLWWAWRIPINRSKSVDQTLGKLRLIPIPFNLDILFPCFKFLKRLQAIFLFEIIISLAYESLFVSRASTFSKLCWLIFNFKYIMWNMWTLDFKQWNIEILIAKIVGWYGSSGKLKARQRCTAISS